MTLLTIFTPTYNRKHTIVRTYKSLLKQTCKDFKWLIIDDGSNDGTREWVLSLGPKIEEQGIAYDWMGRPLNKTTLDHFVIESNDIISDVFNSHINKNNLDKLAYALLRRV